MNKGLTGLASYAVVATLAAGFFAVRSTPASECVTARDGYEPTDFQVRMDEKLERAITYLCQHQDVLNPGRPLTAECERRLALLNSP